MTSAIKTGLMYSPLTSKVYWGRMNTKTGVAAGKNQKDVTSDFIGVMLQKFPVGFKQNIECNGKVEAVIIVLDEEKSHKYSCVNEMERMIEFLVDHNLISDDSMESDCIELLRKAKGDL
ncbi:hypothetical protein MAELSTROM_56 [Pseudoalteromonas phage Maelstrom]|uniref:hypothetical protein n=1 Tax=Pseudoalteromonas phage Maelstrom TaxID=2065202 RepID=UPI000CA3ACCA|nr:hypothetical protein PP584_gp56 [Pseudoalteromonas phage Maelstrom]AUG84975.1 hypothetical protein MAELSTROM_56 [Pseudoalteromonas phage Maelstrom]